MGPLHLHQDAVVVDTHDDLLMLTSRRPEQVGEQVPPAGLEVGVGLGAGAA